MPHQCTDCGRSFDDGSKEMLSGCPNCGGNKFQFQPDRATRQAAAAGDAGGGSTSTEPGDLSGTGSPLGAGDDDIVVADESPADSPSPPEPTVDSTVARTVGRAATTVRDLVGSDEPRRGAPADVDAGVDHHDAPPIDDRAGSPGGTDAAGSSPEDTAQASARADVVSPDDLPPMPDHPATADDRDGHGGAATAPTGDEASADASGEAGEKAYPDPVDRPDLADLREELNEQFESIKVLEPGQYELNLMELYDREEYIIALQEDGKYTIQVPEGYTER